MTIRPTGQTGSPTHGNLSLQHCLVTSRVSVPGLFALDIIAEKIEKSTTGGCAPAAQEIWSAEGGHSNP